MKKLLAIPLMILYLFSVSGAMIQIHFCDQKFESLSISQEAKSCCCEEESASQQHQNFKMLDPNCCSDQTVVVNSAPDQINASAFQFLFSGEKALVPSTIEPIIFSVLKSVSPSYKFHSNAPLGLWQDIPLFKLHQHFVYYG